MNQTELIPIDQVAEQLKTTELNVLMHIKRGVLSGEEHDGRWFVAANSVASFLADPTRKKTDVITCKTHSCGAGGCGSCS